MRSCYHLKKVIDPIYDCSHVQKTSIQKDLSSKIVVRRGDNVCVLHETEALNKFLKE